MYNLKLILGLLKGDEMDGTCSTHGEMKGAYSILVEKTEEERSFWNPRLVWEFNIEKELIKCVMS